MRRKTKEMQHIMTNRAMKRKTVTAGAFTLVEMLVVIALSILLLGLLFGPLISSFNFTRKTQALVAAQDATRFSLERMNREISEAAYVFDNRNLPVFFPLENPANLRRTSDPYNLVYPTDLNGNISSIVPIIGSKIDFIPAATLRAGSNDITDPTTGGNINGAALRFPLATGTRIVRYFVGLRRNLTAGGAQEYYRNVYEFPRTDSDLNAFTLYRAEFEADDPNLIDPANANSTVSNQGGFNDPNFFYNLNKANGTNAQGQTGNGKSYAENWKAISSPIIASDRADVLFWSKNGNKVYTPGAPMQLPVSFGAGTIVGDTATPGFLTNDVSDLAGAIPSLYSARYGQWTLPYTITVYRGVTDNVLDDTKTPGNPLPQNLSGVLRLTVDTRFGTNGAVELRVVGTNDAADPSHSLYSSGVLATNDDDIRYCFTSAGKLFVQTPNVAFLVDPVRGRVETGLPPILGDTGSRAPQMRKADGTQVAIPTLAETGGTYSRHIGDPIQSIYRLNTRDHRAGLSIDPADGNPVDPGAPDYVVPNNQGILVAGLFERRYYPNIPPFSSQILAPPGVAASISPVELFAGNGGTQGISIVAGSERVMGPSPTQSVNLVTYNRVGSVGSLVAKETGYLVTSAAPNYPAFAATATGPLQYTLESDLDGRHKNPVLRFDVLPVNPEPDRYTSGTLLGVWYAHLFKGENVTGLPATDKTDNNTAQREIQVTYLWQNNYARNTSGEPIDVSHRSATDLSPTKVIVPEADVVKVDYSTRALVNVTLGVRIYDPNSGQPENVQVSDKIAVRNLGR